MADPAQKPAKRKAAAIESGPEAKRFRPSFNNTITVLVGEEQEPFVVHIDTICRRSDFFVAACRREWLEGQDKKIPLPGIEPNIFTLYANWAYSGVLDVEIVDDPEPAQDCHGQADGDDTVQGKEVLWGQRQSNIIALYLAADYLRDEVLKERAIDGLLDTMVKSRNLYIRPTLISEIWGSTVTGSGLRMVITDKLMSSAEGCRYIEMRRGDNKVPAEFFVDIAQRLLFMHGPVRALEPSLSRRERYYEREPSYRSASDQESSVANGYGGASRAAKIPHPGPPELVVRYRTLDDFDDSRTRKIVKEMQIITSDSVQRCFDALVKGHGNKDEALKWLAKNEKT
ncbi:hypothetical protein LTR17_003369 [Elasticomyces elasticus]|nr:hypothetical protein LTR17_003369 [Elasticomyces elasticus]